MKHDAAVPTKPNDIHTPIYVSVGVCDSQCTTWGTWLTNPNLDLASDANVELCMQCFEYAKSVSAFNFNYGGSNNAASEYLYPLGSSVPEVYCKDCWAYVGATAFLVVDWNRYTLAINQFQLGVNGAVGYNFDISASSYSSTEAKSVELLRNTYCIGTISIGTFVSIQSTCVLGAETSVSSSFDGSITGKAGFSASQTIGAKYQGSSWSSLSSSSWSWAAPTVDHDINSGSVGMDLYLKPQVILTTSIVYSAQYAYSCWKWYYWGTCYTPEWTKLTLSFQTAATLIPKLSIDVEYGSSRRRLQNAEEEISPSVRFLSSIAVSSHSFLLGEAIPVDVVVTEPIEHIVFRMTSPCWQTGMHLTLLDAPVLAVETLTTVLVPLPYHILMTGGTGDVESCNEFILEASPAQRPRELLAARVRVETDPCAVSCVHAPADGTILDVATPVVFKWNPRKLFWFESVGAAHEGTVKPVEFAVLRIFGSRPPSEAELARGACDWSGEIVDGACIEGALLTTTNGTNNTGTFEFDFSQNTDGMGRQLYWNGTWVDRFDFLYLEITAAEHSKTQARSAGGFFLFDSRVVEDSPEIEQKLAFESLCPAARKLSTSGSKEASQRTMVTAEPRYKTVDRMGTIPQEQNFDNTTIQLLEAPKTKQTHLRGIDDSGTHRALSGDQDDDDDNNDDGWYGRIKGTYGLEVEADMKYAYLNLKVLSINIGTAWLWTDRTGSDVSVTVISDTTAFDYTFTIDNYCANCVPPTDDDDDGSGGGDAGIIIGAICGAIALLGLGLWAMTRKDKRINPGGNPGADVQMVEAVPVASAWGEGQGVVLGPRSAKLVPSEPIALEEFKDNAESPEAVVVAKI